MRYLLCTTALCFITGLTFAQQTLKLSTQTNIAPTFQLNDETYNAISNGLKLSVYDLDKAPIALGIYYTRGYDSSIAFSYGIMAAFIYEIHKRHWVKLGVSNGRLKMDQYKNEYKEGGIQEDDLHKTYFSYLEWEWLFTKHFSLFFKAGYRFLGSETTTLYNKTIPDSGIPDYDEKNDTGFYGSGLEFGIGISLHIH